MNVIIWKLRLIYCAGKQIHLLLVCCFLDHADINRVDKMREMCCEQFSRTEWIADVPNKLATERLYISVLGPSISLPFSRYLSLASLNAPCIPLPRLAPIKQPLQAAQLPNTFKSHKALQSTNSHQAKTLRAPIWRPPQWHTENSNGDKVGVDTAWGEWKKLQGIYLSKSNRRHETERDPGGMELRPLSRMRS